MHPSLHEAAEFLGYALHHFAQCRASDAMPSSPFVGVPNQLEQILRETRTMSDNMTKLLDEQTKLRNDVAAQSTVIASATTAFTGLAAQLAAAEASAKGAGVSDDALAGFVAVRTTLEGNTAALAAAIPTNTPAAVSTETGAALTTESGEAVSTGGTEQPAPTGTEVQI